MKLFAITVEAGKTTKLAVPPSMNFYMHKLGTAGALGVNLFAAGGDLVANMPAIAEGTRYRTSNALEPFVTVEVRNTTQADATCAFYAGMDELIPPANVSGGGGGVASNVSIDSARGLSLYSAEITLSTTATDVKAALPAGATVSDWAFKVSSGTVIMSGTSVGAGMSFEVGKGLAGSNSYPLYLRAAANTARAQVLVSYRT